MFWKDRSGGYVEWIMKGQERNQNDSRDGPWFMLIQVIISRLCHGTREICIQWKPYLEFKILVISQASQKWYDTI